MTKEERNEYMRMWRKKNSDKIKEQNKKYRESHKEQIRKVHKMWRDKNREKINEKAREKYKENPQPFFERKKRYIENNKEKVQLQNHNYKIKNRERCSAYEKNKRHNDPRYRLNSSLNNLIRQYTKKKGYKGTKSIREIIGCDIDTFITYMKSKFTDGMTLENYGKWTIDHIIPISSAKNDEDLEMLNHYTNLQPLWASDNYRKGNKVM